MSHGMSGAASAGRGGVEPESWRSIVMAFAVAAAAVCFGGLSAIVALDNGASAAVSLSLMAAFVVGGVLAAVVMVHCARRGGGRAPDPETLLEWQLSAR